MITILGTLVGGIIAAIAMILNSHLSAKNAKQKDEQSFKRRNFEKYIEEIEKLYEEAIHLSSKLIRNKGRAASETLEKFYRLDAQLSLKSNPSIHSKFKTLKSEISTAAGKLTPLPEEFIPKFEDDEDRRYRMNKRKEIETLRDQEYQDHLSELLATHECLSEAMKEHIIEVKESLTYNSKKKPNQSKSHNSGRAAS
jgi:gas vesicle protein